MSYSFEQSPILCQDFDEHTQVVVIDESNQTLRQFVAHQSQLLAAQIDIIVMSCRADMAKKTKEALDNHIQIIDDYINSNAQSLAMHRI